MRRELLETLFQQNHINSSCIKIFSEENISAVEVLKKSQVDCTVLTFEDEFFVALNPATRKFNLSRLNKITGKSLLEVDNNEEQIIKKPKKKVHVYIDETLENQDEFFIICEEEKNAYTIDIKQLHKLSNDNLIGLSFSDEANKIMDNKETLSFKERVKALHSLPPMPETASQILNLRAIHEVKVEQIVEVMEKDPVLAAQIVSYANSAFFGQAGSVKSLKDAIFRVLGVDAVMNMALALSVGSTFKIPQTGPVGARSVWKSSIYAASLMQRLSMLMPWGERPNPGTAYLVGLLSDIGLLVLGHLFTDEYIELNNYLEKNSDVNILDAEEHVFGITHIEIGKMVMRMWNMPEELIAVATYFSDKKASEEYAKYIQLLTLVKTLLAPHRLTFGDSSEEIPLELLEKLNLDEEDVIVASDEVLSEGEIIKNLVRQMCA